MIEVRCFQPRYVGRDLEDVLEHWEQTANQRGRDDTIADGERALHADHSPVVAHRRKPVDRPNLAEGER